MIHRRAGFMAPAFTRKLQVPGAWHKIRRIVTKRATSVEPVRSGS